MNSRIVRNIIESQNDNLTAITSESSSPLKFVDLKKHYDIDYVEFCPVDMACSSG